MKCIRQKDGTITRVNDSVARKQVDTGKAEYIPRSIWKKEVRGTVDSAKCEGRKEKSEEEIS